MRRDDELLARQHRLLIRSAELRLALAQQSGALDRPLMIVDRTRDAWRWAAANRGLLLGGAALLALLRPRRTMRLAAGLWWGWQLWRRAHRGLQVASSLGLGQRR